MGFRRFNNPTKRMYQSKQFALATRVEQPTPSTGTTTFASDTILISADTVLGISNTTQAAMKRIVVVGIDYYFDGRVLPAADQSPALTVFQNYMGLYKDTLDSSSVPDASGDLFLGVDQVSGTTNQQLFPERIIDRRSFSATWDPSFVPQNLGIITPGINAERRVRRRLSLNAREALIFRVEALIPGTATNALEVQWYGVITYRVDL